MEDLTRQQPDFHIHVFVFQDNSSILRNRDLETLFFWKGNFCNEVLEPTIFCATEKKSTGQALFRSGDRFVAIRYRHKSLPKPDRSAEIFYTDHLAGKLSEINWQNEQPGCQKIEDWYGLGTSVYFARACSVAACYKCTESEMALYDSLFTNVAVIYNAFGNDPTYQGFVQGDEDAFPFFLGIRDRFSVFY